MIKTACLHWVHPIHLAMTSFPPKIVKGRFALSSHQGLGVLLLTTRRAWWEGPPIFCLPYSTGNGMCSHCIHWIRQMMWYTVTQFAFEDPIHALPHCTHFHIPVYLQKHVQCVLALQYVLLLPNIPSGLPLLPGCPPLGPGLPQHPGGWEEAAQDIRHTRVHVLPQGQDATEVDGTRDCTCDRENLYRQVWCVRTPHCICALHVC